MTTYLRPWNVRGPVRVVRQDAGVEHVRVGHHDGAPLAGRAPRVAGRVAVVDRGGREARVGEELADAGLLVAASAFVG
jgi:hypothetical protein